LEKFALTHLSLPVATIAAVIKRSADAVMETRALIPGYIADHPEFQAVGERMLAIWEEGVMGLTENADPK
jgi:serine/threonine-protein kinase HipA